MTAIWGGDTTVMMSACEGNSLTYLERDGKKANHTSGNRWTRDELEELEGLFARRTAQLEIGAALPVEEMQGSLNHADLVAISSLVAMRAASVFLIPLLRRRKLLLTTNTHRRSKVPA